MSDAYFYKGFVFECDVSSPLTIEGNPIPIESAGRKVRAVAPWSGRAIDATSVPALARRIISRSPAFRRRRKETAKHLNVLRSGREAWNRWRRDNPHICPMLACADLHSYHPPLDSYDFSYANLCQANLRGAQLRDANFHQAILAKADLSGAHLEGANFCRTDLYETKFEKAWLTGANLQGVQLAKTDLRGAHLMDCKIYGMSAWDVRLDGDEQRRFIIRYQSGGRRRAKAEEKVEVEDLDLAAFTYLTLHNRNISRVFDTAARKWVLLLGRFSTRKNVLEQLAEALRKRDLIPIIFDFPRPQQRDLVETLLLLAGLSAFVVVDITSPRSTPLELQAIASNYGVPIVPIMKTGTKPFGMFSGLGKFRWILAPLEYDTPGQLIAGLDKAVINPAAAKSQRLINWKEDEPRIRRVRDFLT